MKSFLPVRSSRLRELLILAAIGTVLITLRLAFIHEPLERDEGGYAYIAQEILRGAIPYRDVIDLKPPGVYYIYAVAISLFGNTVESIRLFTAAYSLGSLLSVYWLARHISGVVAGLSASLVFALYSGAPFIQGSSSNTEVFLLLPLLLSTIFLILGKERDSRTYLLLSGVCISLAMLVKTVAFPYAVVLFAGCFWRNVAGKRIGSLLADAASFLLPAVVLAIGTIGYFYFHGALSEFIYWNITLPLAYSKGGIIEGLPFLAVIKLLTPELLLPLIVAFPVAVWLVAQKRKFSCILVALLLPASIIGVWMPGKFFPHYFIQLIPFSTVLCGIGMALIIERRGLPLAVSLPVIIGAFLLYAHNDFKFYFRLTPEEVSSAKYGNVFVDSAYIAEYLKQRSEPDDYILQWGFEPEIYFLANRRAPIPHVSTAIFAGERDVNASISRMLMNIEGKRPKYIVIQPEWGWVAGTADLTKILYREYHVETRLRYGIIFRRR